MKKIILTTLAFALVFSACKKEVEEINPDIPDSSAYNEDLPYKREIVIFDESNENSAMLVIKSNIEEGIDYYLNNTNFKLKTNPRSETESIKNRFINNSSKSSSGTSNKIKGNLTSQNHSEKLESEYTKLILDFEVVSSNLMKSVGSFEIENIPAPSNTRASYPWSGDLKVISGWKSSSDFMGLVVHPNWHPANVKIVKVDWGTLHKPNWYNQFFNISNGLITPNNGDDYYAYVSSPDSYRTQIRTTPVNHVNPYFPHITIVDVEEDFRGRNCQIGGYDGKNCHVGSAPAGTSAFILGSNFYYTYASGANKCPLPGSSDDSANCFVTAIPSSCDAFIWNNNWYVKGDIINI